MPSSHLILCRPFSSRLQSVDFKSLYFMYNILDIKAAAWLVISLSITFTESECKHRMNHVILFPCVLLAGRGELQRAPCTNHVRQSQNITSVPVCRGSGFVPWREAPPTDEQVKVRRRVRPSLAGQSQKWEMERRDTGPYSLAHSRAVEEGMSADSGAVWRAPETRDTAGGQSVARSVRDRALRSAASDSAASAVCPGLHPPSSHSPASSQPEHQAPS